MVNKLKFAKAWEYAPAPETATVEIAPEYGLFINGEFRPAHDGTTMASINPATEEKLFDCAVADRIYLRPTGRSLVAPKHDFV